MTNEDIEKNNNNISLSGTYPHSPEKEISEITHSEYLENKRKLIESEEKFKYLVQYSLEPILIIDLNGSILFANNAVFSLLELDYSPSLSGINVFEFIAPESINDVINDFHQVSSGIDGYIAEYNVITSKGKRITLESIGKIIDYEGKKADLLSLRDITQRKKVELDLLEKERILKESEEMFRNPVENSPIGVYLYQDSGFVYVNPRFALMLGYIRDDLLGRKFEDIVSISDVNRVGCLIKKILEEKLKDSSLEFIGIKKNGDFVYLQAYGSLMQYKNKNAVYGTIIDVTSKKKIEQKIQNNEEKYQIIAENIMDVVWILDSESNCFRYVSPSIKHLCNISSIDIIGGSFDKFFNYDNSGTLTPILEKQKIEFLNNILDKKYFSFETQLICLDGSKITTETYANYFLNQETQKVELLGITRDITERKKTEREIELKNIELSAAYQEALASYEELRAMDESIKEAYKEKETLIREIHHRVKNNMQIISSLLSLQSRNIADKHYKELFVEAQNRIKSLAYVHEFLYQSENLNRINYSEYLKKITAYLLHSYNITPDEVVCNIDIENLELSIEQAVPCSLIITELLTNSFKYAFNNGRKGKIFIQFIYLPDKMEYLLDYKDNGPGFPKDSSHQKKSGFGTSLINGLIKQLSGKLNINSSSSGVHYIFTIPLINNSEQIDYS